MDNFKARSNESIFDAALERYGDVSYCVKLLLDNTEQLEDINTPIFGLELNYDSAFKPEVLKPLVIIKQPDKNKALIYKPYDGQSIFDIALMTIGGFEQIIGLVKGSTLNNINSGIRPSSRFNYTQTDTALLTWVRNTNQVFKSGLIRVTGREHDSSYSTLEFS